MAETFNCSTCGAPLSVSGNAVSIRCPYCNNTVIIPETLRGNTALLPVQANTIDPARIQEIVAMAHSGNKIEAIKRYRELTNVGLKEAKDTVEALMEGRPVEVHAARTVQTTAAGEDIAQLVRSGKKIEAIKRYREQTGLGLKESKNAIEAIEAAQRWGNVLADEGPAYQQLSMPPLVVTEKTPSRMVNCFSGLLVMIILMAILLGCMTPLFLWFLSSNSGQIPLQ